MKKFVEKIVQFRYPVILLILLITGFFLIQITKIELKFDPKAILPQDHPYVQLNNKIEETFGGSRVVVIGVHNTRGDIFNPNTLKKIKDITDEVKLISGIKEDNVVSIADRKIKYIVGTEEEINITQLMPEVPTDTGEISALKERIFSNALFVGSLVSKDGSAAAVIVDFGAKIPETYLEENEEASPDGQSSGASDETWEKEKDWEKKNQGEQSSDNDKADSSASWGKSDEWGSGDWSSQMQGDPNSNCGAWQREIPGEWLADSFIHCQLQDIIDKHLDDDHKIYLGGMPIVLSFFEADAWQMLAVLFPISVLIIGIFHYISFKTWQGLVIPLLTSLLAVVWAMGMMGLTGTPLDPWNAMVPILILAIAAGDSVQILKRYYEEYDRLGDKNAAIIESTGKAGLAMVTAGLIASASFGSLITFKLQTFQAFGLFTAFGLLSALVLELTLIPSLRSIFRAARKKAQSKAKAPDILDRFLGGLASKITGSGRTPILLGGIFVFALSIVGTLQVEVSNSNRSQFFESTVLRQDEKVLNEKFSGTSTFYILLEATKDGALKEPAVSSAVDRLQRRLEEIETVGKTESYVDYVKQMNQTINHGDPAHLRVPDSRAEIAQYLFLYSISGNPADFARLMRPEQNEAVIWVFLKTDDTRLAEKLIAVVDKAQEEDFAGLEVKIGVAGSAPVVVALNEEMVRGKAWNIVQIATITFLMTAFVRRSLVGGFFVIIPLALAVFINFGVMGLAGIQLGIGTATITAMAVGIGAGYEIYLIFRLREELERRDNIEDAVRITLKTSGKAIVFNALAVSMGYSMLAFSGYYLHMEGILVPLAMLTSSLGALAILPSLVVRFKPKFIFSEASLNKFES